MSFSEILDELPKLNPTERQEVLDRLLELANPPSEEESAAELAAIDEGIRSTETGPSIPLAELRKRLVEWTTP